MTRRLILSLVAAVALAACDEPATSPLASADELVARRAEPTRVYDLGTLGGAWSYAWDINIDGVVVGTSETADGCWCPFRWTKRRGMEALETLGGKTHEAVAINKKGYIAGSSVDAAGDKHLVMWKPNGVLVDLGVFADDMQPVDINDHNRIVGHYGDYSPTERKLFYWTPEAGFGTYPWFNQFLGAAAVNNRGDVVGTHTGGAREGVFWLPRGEEFVDLGAPPPYYEGFVGYAGANGINKHRVIVGWSIRHEDLSLPWYNGSFRWTPKDGFEILGAPNDVRDSWATAVNDRGEIVGVLWPELGAYHWSEETGFVYLGPGEAAAINERSQIVGMSLDPNGAPHATLWVGTRGSAWPTATSSLSVSRQVNGQHTGCFADIQTARSRASLLRCLSTAGP
jgi:probable HAF family extracellular repeat protein